MLVNMVILCILLIEKFVVWEIFNKKLLMVCMIEKFEVFLIVFKIVIIF